MVLVWGQIHDLGSGGQICGLTAKVREEGLSVKGAA
jgi:hypothetical protein